MLFLLAECWRRRFVRNVLGIGITRITPEKTSVEREFEVSAAAFYAPEAYTDSQRWLGTVSAP